MAAGGDLAALGGAISVEVCGSWDHAGPCPLAPHHTELEQEGDRDLYRLGLKLLELGSMVLANMEVHREALPYIEELVRETGETVHLGVFDGSQVVSIEKIRRAVEF